MEVSVGVLSAGDAALLHNRCQHEIGGGRTWWDAVNERAGERGKTRRSTICDNRK